MRFDGKAQFIEAIDREHETFLGFANEIGEGRFREPGVWGDDWTVHDLLAHLTEWERMFLRWYREGAAGETPALPAPGFGWRQTPALNREIQERHRDRPTAEVLRDFQASFEEISTLARALDEEDIFTRGRWPWTGRNALITYLGANTVSHYRTASKILRRWMRSSKRA